MCFEVSAYRNFTLTASSLLWCMDLSSYRRAPCSWFCLCPVKHRVASVCAILPLESWSWMSELTWRKIFLLHKVRTSNCQMLPLLACLSSSSCYVCIIAVRIIEVAAAWSGTTCRWENGEILNYRKGQLNLSPRGCCSQWRSSRDRCEASSGSGHWWKQATMTIFHQ